MCLFEFVFARLCLDLNTGLHYMLTCTPDSQGHEGDEDGRDEVEL